MMNIDTTSPMAHPIDPSQPPPPSDQTKQDHPTLSEQEQEPSSASDKPKRKQEEEEEEEEKRVDSGRERLTKHRREMAGRVWIPEIWGQEELLKDWIDCSTFDTCLVPTGISSARAALVQEATRAASSSSARLQRLDHNRCLILR